MLAGGGGFPFHTYRPVHLAGRPTNGVSCGPGGRIRGRLAVLFLPGARIVVALACHGPEPSALDRMPTDSAGTHLIGPAVRDAAIDAHIFVHWDHPLCYIYVSGLVPAVIGSGGDRHDVDRTTPATAIQVPAPIWLSHPVIASACSHAAQVVRGGWPLPGPRASPAGHLPLAHHAPRTLPASIRRRDVHYPPAILTPFPPLVSAQAVAGVVRQAIGICSKR